MVDKKSKPASKHLTQILFMYSLKHNMYTQKWDQKSLKLCLQNKL